MTFLRKFIFDIYFSKMEYSDSAIYLDYFIDRTLKMYGLEANCRVTLPPCL